MSADEVRQTLLSWGLFGGCVLLASLLGTFALRWVFVAVRGRARPHRAVCSTCGAIVGDGSSSVRERCSECGADLSRKGSVRRAAFARSGVAWCASVAIAALLVVLGARLIEPLAYATSEAARQMQHEDAGSIAVPESTEAAGAAPVEDAIPSPPAQLVAALDRLWAMGAEELDDDPERRQRMRDECRQLVDSVEGVTGDTPVLASEYLAMNAVGNEATPYRMAILAYVALAAGRELVAAEEARRVGRRIDALLGEDGLAGVEVHMPREARPGTLVGITVHSPVRCPGSWAAIDGVTVCGSPVVVRDAYGGGRGPRAVRVTGVIELPATACAPDGTVPVTVSWSAGVLVPPSEARSHPSVAAEPGGEDVQLIARHGDEQRSVALRDRPTVLPAVDDPKLEPFSRCRSSMRLYVMVRGPRRSVCTLFGYHDGSVGLDGRLELETEQGWLEVATVTPLDATTFARDIALPTSILDGARALRLRYVPRDGESHLEELTADEVQAARVAESLDEIVQVRRLTGVWKRPILFTLEAMPGGDWRFEWSKGVRGGIELDGEPGEAGAARPAR